MSNTFKAQGLSDFYQKVADGGEAQLKIDGEWSNLFVGGPAIGSSKDVWRIKPAKKVAKPLEQLEKELTEAYITFNCPADNPMLKLSKEGFLFNGELIEDAGEAHGVFLEVMELMKKEQDNG